MGSAETASQRTLAHRAREWAKSIAIAVAIWFLITSFAVQAFRIPSASMEPTLLVGDFLFVNKAIYGAKVPFVPLYLPAFREPRRNEIVIFRSPIEPLTVVKRLVGVPGDTLAMVGGRLVRNGDVVDEPYAIVSTDPVTPDPAVRERMRAWQRRYLLHPDSAYAPDPHNWGPVVVPPDSFFVMGDHRDESLDSRFWGFLPRRNIRGTPLFIYFSYDARSWKPLPFLTAIRWKRFFHVPR